MRCKSSGECKYSGAKLEKSMEIQSFLYFHTNLIEVKKQNSNGKMKISRFQIHIKKKEFRVFFKFRGF